MEKPNPHNKIYWKEEGTDEFLYQKYICDLETYINMLEKRQLSISRVVRRSENLPKEVTDEDWETLRGKGLDKKLDKW